MHNGGCKRDRRYACQECLMAFQNFRNLKQHVQAMHAESLQRSKFVTKLGSDTSSEQEAGPDVQCDIRILCHANADIQPISTYQTPYKGNLRVHSVPPRMLRRDPRSINHVYLSAYTGERPYKCKECSLSFKFASNLRQHVARHAKVTLAVTSV